MCLGHVKLACGGHLNVLVVGNDFYSDDDVHLNPFHIGRGNVTFRLMKQYKNTKEN